MTLKDQGIGPGGDPDLEFPPLHNFVSFWTYTAFMCLLASLTVRTLWSQVILLHCLKPVRQTVDLCRDENICNTVNRVISVLRLSL